LIQKQTKEISNYTYSIQVNWSKLTYQQKNKILGIGYLVFLVVVYQLAISKSWELYDQNAVLETKLANDKASYANREELEQKQAMLDHRISSFFIDSLNNEKILLETISTYCRQHHVLLNELPAIVEYREGNFEIGTYKIVLEGNYIPLVKMIYLLEQKSKIGRVSSVKFDLKYDYKRKKEVLSMTLYIQNIQLHADEKES